MKEAHITYKDEDDQQITGWFELIELNAGYVKFLTGKNTITIPLSRVIKIKERGGAQ